MKKNPSDPLPKAAPKRSRRPPVSNDRTILREKFEEIWEAGPDASLIVSEGGLIVMVNSHTERLFGYGREELLGKPVDKLIPERFRNRHVGFRMSYTASPRTRPMGAGLALYGLRKDGSEFPLEISLSPLKFGDEIMVASTIRDISERKRAEELIAQQSRSLMELSTPVIRLWKDIVLLPLIGVVDTLRAQQIMENLLQAIVDAQARVALLDITGVPVIDTQVAHHLMKTVAAAKMLGAEVIVTGISPESAQTLVTLGIKLSDIRTRGSLQSGVAEAFRLIGKPVLAQDLA